MPSALPVDVLDEAVPDRPVLVLDDLGHAAWTNSLGLAAAGIGADDPDPQGGILHRDDRGRLTGLLLENAQQLVRDAGTLDPFGTIERTLRRPRQGVPDLATVLAAMTIEPARALGHDHLTGSIEVGKAADYVVVDQPLFDLPVDRIDETTVLRTVVDGRVVHDLLTPPP